MFGTFVDEFFVKSHPLESKSPPQRATAAIAFQLLASGKRLRVGLFGELMMIILVRGVHRVFSNSSAVSFHPFSSLVSTKNRIGPGQPHHLRIAQPIWFRDNDFVARLTGSENGVCNRNVFAPVLTMDLGRAVSELIVLMKFF